MVRHIVISGLFCEDIREDSDGLHSLIRIFPDAVTLPSFPNMLRGLGFYLRVSVGMNFAPTPIQVVLRMPGHGDMPLTSLTAALIKQAQEEATEEGMEFGTIVTTAMSAGFPVPSPLRITAIALVNGQEVPCATLNFELAR